MSFRDDHDAALARTDAAEREARLLAGENQRLTSELAEAREWLGGPRKRLVAIAALVVVAGGLAIGGVVVGRSSIECPVPVIASRTAPLPTVTGVMVADGPKLGHWTLAATRCVQRSDGIELTAVGSEDHNIWLTNNVTEIEVPTGDILLEDRMCRAHLARAVIASKEIPPTYSGFVELDCHFDDNRLQGRIEFSHCQ